MVGSHQKRSLLNREICQRSLHEFIRYFWNDMDPSVFRDGWHIGAICEHLQAVTDGEIKFLLINVPPRHMKSLACSVAWPAWIWTQKRKPERPLAGPHVRFLSASYAQSLSVRDSMKMRRLIQSSRYRAFWGDRVEFSKDQMAKGRFETTAQGYRIATSVGGTATGEGGDIILVDDAANADEAQSEIERENVIEWWTGTMATRLNDPSTAARVIIAQRLHHQDLPGYVIEHSDIVHLCLPARYESDHPFVYARDPRTKEGEPLWPDQVPEKTLDELEAEMGPYKFAGQFQQRPTPREGGTFSRGDFEIVDAAPAKGKKVRAWDLAGSRGKTSPYTVGELWQRTGNEYYVLDVIRERTTPAKMHDLMKNTASQDRAAYGGGITIDFPQDPGQAGKDQRRIITGELAGYNVRSTVESGSKETRAEPFAAQAGAGNVKLVRGPWNKAFLDELELFPNSDFSDQVDAGSRAFARLTRKRSKVGAGGAVMFG